MTLPTTAVFDITDPLPSGTVLLEASAGTGKTWTIAAVCAKAVATGRARMEDLLIVTFNRSAARELRGRVHSRLVEARAVLSGQQEPEDECSECLMASGPEGLARIDAALDAFDRATITTTHQFSSRMLAELGVLCDHDPASVLLADPSPIVTEVSDDLYLARHVDAVDPPNHADMTQFSLDVAMRYGEVPISRNCNSEEYLDKAEWAQTVRTQTARRARARGVHTFDDLIADLACALDDPVRGEDACTTLARRFPLVLVDEFQDTDPLQWHILHRAFHERSDLWLIGDPKQSIYAFRGADVHAYVAASGLATETRALGVNHRADEPVVQAVSHLFGTASLGGPIRLEPVGASHHSSRVVCTRQSGHRYDWSTPFQVRCLETPGEHHTMRTTESDDLIAADVLNQVVMMLEGGSEVLDEDGGPRPLEPSDIAILVRRRARGEAIARTLSAAGQPVVFSGSSPVWRSRAAKDLADLLDALEDADPTLRTRLCLTPLMGAAPADLAGADSRVRSDVAIDLGTWATRWDRARVWGTVESALHRPGTLARLVSTAGGERYVTDLRQVAQAAHAAAVEGRLSPSATADWVRDEARRASDEDPRRLDTDRQAVSIMTVHASKGLGFPVVLLPDIACSWRRKDHGGPLVWHDGERRVLDLGSDLDIRQRAWSDHEADELAEDMRILYVALTRARSAIRLWWTPCPKRNKWSAFQRLLEMDRADGTLGTGGEGISPWEAPWLVNGPIGLVNVPLQQSLLRTPEAGSHQVVAARPLDRAIDQDWGRTSYSGLTVGTHHAMLTTTVPEDLPDEPPEELPDEPSEATTDELSEETATTSGTGLCAMPGGTSFGTLVHAVLEYTDTAATDLDAEIRLETQRILRTSPMPGVDVDDLVSGLSTTMHTSLGVLTGGLCLADLKPSDRLAEMTFELAMSQHPGASTVADLAELLSDPALVPPGDPIDGYGRVLAAAPAAERVLSGFLTGSIDAVLRLPDGRHVVVDYKTNRVPGIIDLAPHHYDAATMQAMMFSSHYPLQGLLYSAALHRFLRAAMPEYDPSVHLGPVGYLFVRGMAGHPAPDEGMPDGVFVWHPRPELIIAVSECLGGPRA